VPAVRSPVTVKIRGLAVSGGAVEVEPGGEPARGGPADLGAWGPEWRRAAGASLLRSLSLVLVESISRR
jgi:hypothetical protein